MWTVDTQLLFGLNAPHWWQHVSESDKFVANIQQRVVNKMLLGLYVLLLYRLYNFLYLKKKKNVRYSIYCLEFICTCSQSTLYTRYIYIYIYLYKSIVWMRILLILLYFIFKFFYLVFLFFNIYLFLCIIEFQLQWLLAYNYDNTTFFVIFLK
jgi:hypothetical protein